MRSAEREKLSKKVKNTSLLFAILASVGFLIIGIQLFSGKAGFDFFENISYSISKLFASDTNEKTKKTKKESSNEVVNFETKKTENTETLEQSRKKAEELLKNQILLSPILPETQADELKKNNKIKPNKFSQININPLLKIIFDETNTTPVYLPKNIKIGLLPEIKTTKRSKIALGLSLTTGLSDCRINYKINKKKSEYGYYQTEKSRNANNNVLLKYSFGLDLFYRINKNINLNTGLYYTNTGESVLLKEPDENTLCKNYNKANDEFFKGYPDFETPDLNAEYSNLRFNNNISYFELPLIFDIKINNINELTDIELQSGISYGRLYFANTVVYNFGNNAFYTIAGQSPDIYRKNSLNAILGLVYNKYITTNIQLFANPQFKIGITNTFSDKYEVKQRNYTNSLRLGMKINL
ncbi:MAG: hypothetical protein HUU47_00540 [Bacteroidetes bacterium]|nr:hypothetical protein [Bacteroidota bacterium]